MRPLLRPAGRPPVPDPAGANDPFLLARRVQWEAEDILPLHDRRHTVNTIFLRLPLRYTAWRVARNEPVADHEVFRLALVSGDGICRLHRRSPMPRGRTFDSVTQTIGDTPLVRLNRVIPPGGAEVFAKCEFFQPLNSVKDRIGVAMIEAGERDGKVTPGTRIVEPTRWSR